MKLVYSFELGDRVAYKREFLKSIGAYTGEIPQARGKIIELKTFSYFKKHLATVQWDDGTLGKVLCDNLVLVENIQYEER